MDNIKFMEKIDVLVRNYLVTPNNKEKQTRGELGDEEKLRIQNCQVIRKNKQRRN